MNIYQIANQMKINHQTIYDINIRVAYYVRVSTLREQQDSSVDNQIIHFEKLIKSHPNWTFVNGYVDRVRGESASNRESFMQMIEDGKSDKFDLLLTKEVSRFARNTIDSLTYTRELLRYGVGVLFENDNICTIDTDAEFRLTIMASIAQDEVRKLSERVKFGQKQSISKGIVMGNSRIYGYDKNNGKLVINKPEAEMIQLIFNMYATGKYALRAIERELWDRGYRSRSGNRIHHNTIGAIINNPKYKGYYCGNKVKIVDYRTKEQVFLPEEDWIMYKDTTGEIVPAIVSEELWETAHTLFLQRSNEIKSRGRGKKTTSALSGKIFCTHHKACFWRTSYSHRLHKEDGNIYQWICKTKKQEGTLTCPTFAIYETEIYSLLKQFFVMLANEIDDCVETFISVYNKFNDGEQFQKEINNLQVQLDKYNKKKEKILDLYTDGLITKEDFKIQNDKLNTGINVTQNSLQDLQKKKINVKETEKNLTKMRDMIKDIINNKNNCLTNDDVDSFVSFLIERIDVSADNNSKTMKINIILKDGKTYPTNFNRSSGHIIKQICPERNITFKRIRGREVQEIVYITYVSMSI